MLGKNNPQIDVFNHMIFERLIPKDHLLVKIDSIIDFSFVYDMVKEKYSDIGRKSEDPVMMLKICLLQFLYNLSDPKVIKRIQTDIAFRWFLGLSLDDEVPDDTTICHFRTNRMGEENFGEFFNEIVRKCIEKDKIVSVVDPDAKIAHKSSGNIKRGHKDHIIVDEDSEIILAAVQTPFNVGDEKKLIELVEKVEKNLGLKSEEITTDKIYETINNRAYLKDNEIISNIDFYEESSREVKYCGLADFTISEDLKTATCPNRISMEEHILSYGKTEDKESKIFKFDKKICQQCPLKEQCLYKDKNGKFFSKGRRLEVPLRYDAVIKDMKRVETKEYEEASNNRFKMERRFATMVRNHGLRRCRYLGISRAKIHITLANMACNIVRMVNLLCQPSLAASQN